MRRNKGFSLIEIMVVIVIIAVLAIVLLPKYMGSRNAVDKGGAMSPVQKAESVQCMTNLQQVRGAINMYAQGNEQNPASIADLSQYGVSGSITKCPISGTTYSYDPSQGRAWCSTPGHEKY